MPLDPLEVTAGIAIGTGVGQAIGDVVTPKLQDFKNERWSKYPHRPLAAEEAAALAAQHSDSPYASYVEALNNGINEERFHALRELAFRAPPYAEALELWRRGKIGREQVRHALAKAQIEPQYWEPLLELFTGRLDPAVLALAIVRGIVRDPGFLPVGPPTSEGKVKAFPVSPINAIEEARAHGIDEARLFVETAIAGRPMGPEGAAAAVFRGILERVDYDRAIAEGDVRNEWADAIFEAARQIPSVADYVALHLRGHTDAEGMHAGAARHGMSPADADRIYLARGRPAAPGQMATAAARGIDGPAGVPMNREQFLLGIAESDIRPEWGPMLWEARYLYPPLFQLSRLVTAGAIDADTAAEWARKDRYPPEVVSALHAFWSKSVTGTADPHVAKADNHVWATMHASYKNGEADAPALEEGFALLDVAAGARAAVLERWDYERSLVRRQLTPAQIKKAYTKAETNPATEQPWTQDEAIARLIAQGMSPDDALSFLNL